MTARLHPGSQESLWAVICHHPARAHECRLFAEAGDAHRYAARHTRGCPACADSPGEGPQPIWRFDHAYCAQALPSLSLRKLEPREEHASTALLLTPSDLAGHALVALAFTSEDQGEYDVLVSLIESAQAAQEAGALLIAG